MHCWVPARTTSKSQCLLVLQGIATAHNCSVAQVVLAWGLHRGQVVIPRSSSPKHQRENYDAWQMRLSAQEVAAINALDDTRVG
jgi:2,5-diketo-D-gluconate reductase A